MQTPSLKFGIQVSPLAILKGMSLHKQIPDLADARSENPMPMTLLSNGTGVVVVELAV